MMLTPGGAVLVGAIAAVLSVCGFRFDYDVHHGDRHIQWSIQDAEIQSS